MDSPGKRILIALDFDHTIIDGNSDIYINKLAPNETIPSNIKDLYTSSGWTFYMREVFKFLHGVCGVTSNSLLSCVSEIPLMDGFKELLTKLPLDKTEFIIISDSNEIFIKTILEKHNLLHLFKTIYTNPGKFLDNGCLHIEMYHSQNYCNLSTINLCKGKILHDHVYSRAKDGINFERIAYIGDGTNDYCPSLCLRKCDVIYPRVGYNLLKYLNDESNQSKLRAKVISWQTGTEIYDHLIKYYDLPSNDSSSNVLDPSEEKSFSESR